MSSQSLLLSQLESEVTIYTTLLEQELSTPLKRSLQADFSSDSDEDDDLNDFDNRFPTQMNDNDDSNDENDEDATLASFPIPSLAQDQERKILLLQTSLQAAFELQQKIQSQIDLIHANIQTLYSRVYPSLSKLVPTSFDYATVLTILLDPNDPSTPYQSVIPSPSSSSSQLPPSTALSNPSTSLNHIAVLSDLHTTPLSKRDRLADKFPAQLALSIAVEHQQLQHDILTSTQYHAILSGANDILTLHRHSTALAPFFTSRAQQLAPNLTQLITAQFAAQFLFFANGLAGLCSTLPQNLRSFGATKQHLVGNSANTLAGKVGIITHIPLIQHAPEDKKKRAISLVSHKIILAARNDYQGLYKDGSYGEQLYREIASKIDVFKKTNPYKTEKALPISSQQRKPRRAGRLERLKKARLQPSELSKRADMLKFGDGSGEVYDDMTGIGLGTIGNEESSKGVLHQKSTTLSTLHIDKDVKRRLDHFRKINDIRLNAFPILLGLKKTQFLLDSNSQELDFQQYSSQSQSLPSTSPLPSHLHSAVPIPPLEHLIFGLQTSNNNNNNDNNDNKNNNPTRPIRSVPHASKLF